MDLNRRTINKILGRVMMALGIIFLLYVGLMYYLYFFTNWQTN